MADEKWWGKALEELTRDELMAGFKNLGHIHQRMMDVYFELWDAMEKVKGEAQAKWESLARDDGGLWEDKNG